MAKHTVKASDYNMIIACKSDKRLACTVCARLSNARCKLADFIHDSLGGKLPELRFDPDRQRFFSFFEMIDRPRGGDASLSTSGFEPCLLCGFECRSSADLQRHKQLLHPEVSLTALHLLPFGCNFRLERSVDSSNAHYGPYSYCRAAFATPSELEAHKKASGHKRKKPCTPLSPPHRLTLLQPKSLSLRLPLLPWRLRLSKALGQRRHVHKLRWSPQQHRNSRCREPTLPQLQRLLSLPDEGGRRRRKVRRRAESNGSSSRRPRRRRIRSR